MTIEERTGLYKKLFPECRALSAVKAIIDKGFYEAGTIQQIELLRELDTELAKAYKVWLPVVTFFVRDHNYVTVTKEIYLGELSIEAFLHQFRHHLQNEARDPNKRLLLVEDNKDLDDRIPYKDTVYLMRGEDDAVAWARFIIESV